MSEVSRGFALQKAWQYSSSSLNGFLRKARAHRVCRKGRIPCTANALVNLALQKLEQTNRPGSAWQRPALDLFCPPKRYAASLHRACGLPMSRGSGWRCPNLQPLGPCMLVRAALRLCCKDV